MPFYTTDVQRQEKRIPNYRFELTETRNYNSSHLGSHKKMYLNFQKTQDQKTSKKKSNFKITSRVQYCWCRIYAKIKNRIFKKEYCILE